MSECRSGCKTQNHATYAECLRAGTPRIAYANSANGWDRSRQKRWDSELDEYRAARREGIQPLGTTRRDVDRARKWSDVQQQPFAGNAIDLRDGING